MPIDLSMRPSVLKAAREAAAMASNAAGGGKEGEEGGGSKAVSVAPKTLGMEDLKLGGRVFGLVQEVAEVRGGGR